MQIRCATNSLFEFQPTLPRFPITPVLRRASLPDMSICSAPYAFSLVLTYKSYFVLWTEWALLLSTSVQFWVALKRAGCVLLEKQAYPPNP